MTLLGMVMLVLVLRRHPVLVRYPRSFSLPRAVRLRLSTAFRARRAAARDISPRSASSVAKVTVVSGNDVVRHVDGEPDPCEPLRGWSCAGPIVVDVASAGGVIGVCGAGVVRAALGVLAASGRHTVVITAECVQELYGGGDRPERMTVVRTLDEAIGLDLAQAVERSVSRHRSCLHPQATTETVEPPEPQGDKPSHSALKASTRFADRTREKHAKIHALIVAGHSLRSISRQLGMTHRTVGRFAHAATPEVLLWGQWQNKPSMVDDFKPYLQQRWAEGHTNATHLLKEIKALGYRGSYGMLSNYLRPLRSARPVTAAPPTVRKVTGWIMTRPDNLDDSEQLRLQAVLDRCPELAALATHVRSFAIMLTQRQGHQLPQWLTAVRADDLPSLHGFGNGLEHDLDAVTAGLTLPWSSGAVEGQVNRIKMLKRQTFGRAGFPLLRKRVLHTT